MEENRNTRPNEIKGLQILKFICALMVIQIHAYSFIHPYVIDLCRIAVPVFFMISGFFLSNDAGQFNSRRVKRAFSKILKIALLASLGYLLFFGLGSLVQHRFHEFVNNNLCVDALIACVFYEPRFGPHLWYLTAFIHVLVILYICIVTKKIAILYWVIPIGIVANLLLGKYNFLVGLNEYNIPLQISRNSLTIGIPSFMIGALLRKCRLSFPKLKESMIMVVATGFCLCAEAYLHNKYLLDTNGDILLFTIPLAVVTFILFYRLELNHSYTEWLVDLGREHSLNMYILQWAIIGLITLSLSFIGISQDIIKPYFAFIVMAVALVLSNGLNRFHRNLTRLQF